MPDVLRVTKPRKKEHEKLLIFNALKVEPVKAYADIDTKYFA